MHKIYFEDNLKVLKQIESASIDLIYIDPPFNTGKIQKRTQIESIHDDKQGDRVGFQGKKYRTKKISSAEYNDEFDDYIGFLEPRLIETKRVLKADGSLFFHIDYREVHYCKLLLDKIFGRDSFINEIIWAYDFGARSKKKWSTKHDNLLWYAKDPDSYTFNYDEIDRIPYMAPGLVGKEKAARGKTPTDVWWHTIVGTNSKEKTGYPTQKPIGIIERIIKIHSNPNDIVLDFFAGSGTIGETCMMNNRNSILVDNNTDALIAMAKRFSKYSHLEISWFGFTPTNQNDQMSLFNHT